jgi:hypothetical protein
MGGYDSTRWNYERIRQDTDPLLKLDVRWLNRVGALRPGAMANPSWSRRGEPSGSIVTIMSQTRPCLNLSYSTQRPGEEWQPVKESVWLDTTPCNFGGGRIWFLCPGCNCRRAVLFSVGGRFRCRTCHDLAYTSTREDAQDRAIRRCAELRCKLGGSFGQPIWTIPPKPVGMTYRRYHRIVAQLIVEIHRCEAYMDAWYDNKMSDIDRLLAMREQARRRSGI